MGGLPYHVLLAIRRNPLSKIRTALYFLIIKFETDFSMQALVLTTNFRNFDNWEPLFQTIIKESGSCEILSLPFRGDPSVVRMQEIESRYSVRYRQELSGLDESAITNEQLSEILQFCCTDEIDVLFLCDVQSYPSRSVLGILETFQKRPKVIGLQHGLFQSWWLINNNFCIDHLFLFGDRHLQMLAPTFRSRASVVGLPKLDRLQNYIAMPGDYIAYLDQNVIDLATLENSFSKLKEITALPVRIREHPQYPVSKDFTQHHSDSDILEFLAQSCWVITPHSTGGIEALYLNKPLVLLPNAGLTAWAGYPGIAWQLDAQAIFAAKDRLTIYSNDVSQFLDDVVGGIRFDHTKRALEALTNYLHK